ncbi:unnamed protein product [Lactuca virosa]|uniref:Uncharacterized protein n=1 Tax=Lactuca virosa TaxID=75947 RepID=A0AAU9MW90_9ASTR|nr:unnamed protein product [Lactuca virosa]
MLPTSQGRTQELGLSASSGRTRISALPPSHSTNSSSALVEYMSPKSNQEDEDLEVKRYRIKETSISQFIQRLLSNPQNTNLILNPQYREITQNPVFTSKSQLTSPETMQILCIINYSSPLSRRKTQGTTRYIRSSENGTTTSEVE